MMGSTGEPDRKRRHFNSISPTGATAKKQPLVPLSEDKKLDTAVLKFQNQKLVQKLESQKVECLALENKFNLLRSKQLPYDKTSALVDKSWKELVDKVEARSMQPKDLLGHCRNLKQHSVTADSALLTPEDVFLSRLLETGATQSSSSNSTPDQMEEDRKGAGNKTKNILHNIVTVIDGMWRCKDELYANVMEELPEDGSGRQKVSDNLLGEVKSLRSAIGDIHLKHKSLVREIQIHQDTDAKNKAELKRLKGDLESTIVELEESNKKLAVLKAATDAAKGAILPVLLGNKHVANDRTRDKEKDLHDMESLLKELLDQASSRQLELKHLHEERVEILKQLASLQNTLKNVKFVSSSQAYALVRDQITKAKADIGRYQVLFEKLQVEKDNLAWHEKEVSLKTDVVDVLQKSYAVADSRITELENEIQKQIDGKNLIEAKLEEASKEAGRKDIIAEFKALVSSFPEDMGSMQTQLSKYKEAASDVHSLRADVRFLSSVLDRMVKELEALSDRSDSQVAEVQKLRAVIHDLEESDSELQLILEMYMRESSDSRDVLEARNSEYKAWAHVQSLNSSLDEDKLELRVKTAIEAEAMSQQRLAVAEAEIADLRQKLERSKREKARLSDVLKSKHEQNEAYLSEIETIGQAYDDMQTQNQQLLQQITERDDYNIKLVLEGVRARQLLDALLMEKETVERRAQQGNALLNFYEMKTAKIEDQLKSCSEQVQKLSEERIQITLTLDNTRRRLLDIRKSSQQFTESQEESQKKLVKSRVDLSELQIELETERFEKKRVEEELEVVRRKASRLRSELEGSSVVEKLQQELSEYREILKCSICLDRRKEVVITKCYHLFCNLCIQKIIETRHRKCPVCAASFGANDVKPVYI